MKKLFIILIAVLNFAALSCKEQDFFADTAKPHIKNLKVGNDFVNFQFLADTSKKTVIFIASIKLEPKEFNQYIKKFTLDTNDWVNSERIDNNFYLIYSGSDSLKNIHIKNLPKSTTFFMYFFEQNDRKLVLTRIKQFSTLAVEPNLQSQNITFGNLGKNQISVNWTNGNGDGRIVLIRKDSMPSLPEDGVFYKASVKYGSDSTKTNKNGTYCIFNSNFSKDNKVVVTNLQEGTYYFMICEYNGLGNFVNYLTDSSQNNPRHKSTSISAPVALPATMLANNTFYANWKDNPDAEYYMLEISDDLKFGNVFDKYNSIDVGDSNTVEVVLPEDFNGNQVYYRLRAFAKGNISKNSNVITVNLIKNAEKGK